MWKYSQLFTHESNAFPDEQYIILPIQMKGLSGHGHTDRHTKVKAVYLPVSLRSLGRYKKKFLDFTTAMSFVMSIIRLTFIGSPMYKTGVVLRLCVWYSGSNKYLSSRSSSGLDFVPVKYSERHEIRSKLFKHTLYNNVYQVSRPIYEVWATYILLLFLRDF